ncbi:MAG: hypothetical protein ACHQHN_14520 [Sphingobacteriales bacterium]
MEVRSLIEEIEQDRPLYEEKNFEKRIEAIDFLEFHIIAQINAMLQTASRSDELLVLKSRVEKLKSDLEKIDTDLFRKLRADIRLKKYPGKDFFNLVNEYVDFDLADDERQGKAGYDNLDIFINGLLSLQAMPEQTKALEPEMVFYQKTPARIVFELVEKAQFTKDDIFIDLGSGLGQAAILVNLLAGITCKGIEFEPSFCDYARACAIELNLPGVTFVNTDARKADYSEGTVFFMYTPFSGEMLRQVLELLRKESLLRKIKIITYGPCTAEVTAQTWLHSGATSDNIYKLTVFTGL